MDHGLLSRWHRFRVALLKTITVAFDPRLSLEASGLTYYTLLSLVPVLAFIFGIAKGFGLEEFVSEQIRHGFSEHEQVATLLLQFSQTLLGQARGGIIAGIGILVLLWSSIKLLSHIERSLNFVWSANSGRTFFRKFSDYLAVLIVCPFLLLVSTSLALALQTEGLAFFEGHQLLRPFSIALASVPHITPVFLLFGAFTFLYSFFPNRSVPLSSAIGSAVFATLGVIMIQAVFVRSQIFFAQFGAVYGSFSVLPLFLLWLYCTWMVVLIGAHFGYLLHESRYSLNSSAFSLLSSRDQELYSLLACARIATRFHRSERPQTLHRLAQLTRLPEPLLEGILQNLTEREVLLSVQTSNGETAYLPRVPLESFKPSFVLGGLAGEDRIPSLSEQFQNELEPFSKLLHRRDTLLCASEVDTPLHLLCSVQEPSSDCDKDPIRMKK